MAVRGGLATVVLAASVAAALGASGDVDPWRPLWQGDGGWSPARSATAGGRAALRVRRPPPVVLQGRSRLEARARTEYVPPVCFVWAHLGTGDADAAMAGLERLVEDRDPQSLWVPFSPTYEPLRAHPPFADLLRRLPRLPAPATSRARS